MKPDRSTDRAEGQKHSKVEKPERILLAAGNIHSMLALPQGAKIARVESALDEFVGPFPLTLTAVEDIPS